MQYSLMIYQIPVQFADRTDPARRAPFEHCGSIEVRPTRIVPSA
ncbi:MAG: hypothetical protein ACRELE_08460 [Gemmatimonadales bacterium]